MTQTHNARQGKQEVQHCDAGSGWAASRADRTNERRCHRTETASGDGAWGPGRGLCLKNEWKPLEDLQMVRCKVSCPPPQSLGCKPHAPRLHSGGDSGRLNGPGQRGRPSRGARDASGAVHGRRGSPGSRASQQPSAGPGCREKGARATSSDGERVDVGDVRWKETGRSPDGVGTEIKASINCARKELLPEALCCPAYLKQWELCTSPPSAESAPCRQDLPDH